VEPAAAHFGKYRGKRYDEIAATDRSYLEWIVDKSDLDEGINTAHAIG
jgi:hypothetical protein